MSDEIKVGDTIRHKGLANNAAFDVKVLGIETCEGSGLPGAESHPAFRVTDPETREPDTVCSRDVFKVASATD